MLVLQTSAVSMVPIKVDESEACFPLINCVRLACPQAKSGKPGGDSDESSGKGWRRECAFRRVSLEQQYSDADQGCEEPFTAGAVSDICKQCAEHGK